MSSSSAPSEPSTSALILDDGVDVDAIGYTPENVTVEILLLKSKIATLGREKVALESNNSKEVSTNAINLEELKETKKQLSYLEAEKEEIKKISDYRLTSMFKNWMDERKARQWFAKYAMNEYDKRKRWENRAHEFRYRFENTKSAETGNSVVNQPPNSKLGCKKSPSIGEKPGNPRKICTCKVKKINLHNGRSKKQHKKLRGFYQGMTEDLKKQYCGLCYYKLA